MTKYCVYDGGVVLTSELETIIKQICPSNPFSLALLSLLTSCKRGLGGRRGRPPRSGRNADEDLQRYQRRNHDTFGHLRHRRKVRPGLPCLCSVGRRQAATGRLLHLHDPFVGEDISACMMFVLLAVPCRITRCEAATCDSWPDLVFTFSGVTPECIMSES